MIPIDLAAAAAVTGGALHGDGGVVVDSAAIDSRAAVPGTLFVALAGDHVDGHDYVPQALERGATGVLSSRRVDAPCVVVEDVTSALGLLARENLRHAATPVVAVTGSQGKTSVKDLLAHVLAGRGPTVAATGSFNNELGVPLTVLRVNAATRFLVVEMGARGIGHIADLCRIAPPDVGVVLNVGHAHVGEFGSAAAIAQAKGEIIEAVGPLGVAVLNADDELVAPMASRTSAKVLTFGASGEVALGPVTLDEAGTPHFTLSHEGVTLDATVPQIGAHHGVNAAAAAAAAIAVGLDLSTVVDRLRGAHAASPMRMERHERADGLVVINDAYNANPESMSAALHAVAGIAHGRGVAVLGEMLELGEDAWDSHVQIGRLAAQVGYHRVLVVGDGARGIAEGAGEIAESVADVDVAIRTLSASLRGDEVVLVKASRGGRLERVAQALLER